MSPVSRGRRGAKRPQQLAGGTADTDVVAACDMLISHLDGTLAERGRRREVTPPPRPGIS